MKKLFLVITVTLVTTAGCGSMPGHHMQSGSGMMTHMKTYDRNGDGMLSKDEFMQAHEAMFDRMKGPNGMIDLKDMPMHGKGMMGHGG